MEDGMIEFIHLILNYVFNQKNQLQSNHDFSLINIIGLLCVQLKTIRRHSIYDLADNIQFLNEHIFCQPSDIHEQKNMVWFQLYLLFFGCHIKIVIAFMYFLTRQKFGKQFGWKRAYKIENVT